MTKQFDIPKELVMRAYKLVKANAGAGGVDKQTLADFERDLKGNLYKIWRHFNKTLVAWAMKKYKSLRRKKVKAAIFIEKIAAMNPKLFVHWRNGMIGSFA